MGVGVDGVDDRGGAASGLFAVDTAQSDGEGRRGLWELHPLGQAPLNLREALAASPVELPHESFRVHNRKVVNSCFCSKRLRIPNLKGPRLTCIAQRT